MNFAPSVFYNFLHGDTPFDERGRPEDVVGLSAQAGVGLVFAGRAPQGALVRAGHGRGASMLRVHVHDLLAGP